MMQENISEVALELADRLRAARNSWECTDDLSANIGRLFIAQGSTPVDALAALSVCAGLLSAINLNDYHDPDQRYMIERGLQLLTTSIDILEHHTGISADSFFGLEA